MKNKDFYNFGKLVKHSYQSDLGTGIIKEQRTKEKFCRETGEGGLFVQQYKVWFSASGEAWYDASVLLYLPTDLTASPPIRGP